MAMALKCLMDVKVQDAKWFHLIVSLTIILKVKNNKYLFRTKTLLHLPNFGTVVFRNQGL